MEAVNFDRLFVITGGPGSGKSTLINALAGRGISTMPEAGRAIIQDQMAIGGEALHWSDRRAFAELMLSWEMRSYRAALRPVMFDRGVPDVLGYLRLSNLAIPSHVNNASRIFRYHRRVFIAPPWPQIFELDRERKQTFEEAQATHKIMTETYSALGYELISLPLDSVQARVRYVLAAIG
jgi:predicted ATPase